MSSKAGSVETRNSDLAPCHDPIHGQIETTRTAAPIRHRETIVLRYFDEVLPLDAERRAEFDVWLAFMAQARAESGAGALQEHVDTVHNGLRQLCESLLRSLADAGVLKEGLDLRREVEVLHALLDGLALHAAIQPDRTTPTRLRQLMRRQLESLMVRNP